MDGVEIDSVETLMASISEVYLPVLDELEKEASTDEAAENNGIIAAAYMSGAWSALMGIHMELLAGRTVAPSGREGLRSCSSRATRRSLTST